MIEGLILTAVLTAIVGGTLLVIFREPLQQSGWLSKITIGIWVAAGLAILAVATSPRNREQETFHAPPTALTAPGTPPEVPSAPPVATPVPKPEAKPDLEIKLTSHSYDYGFAKVVGTVKNSGNAPAFSPVVKVRVYKDKEHTVLLAEDTALIAGQFLKQMEPGIEAAFQSIIPVPGEPEAVYWDIWVEQK